MGVLAIVFSSFSLFLPPTHTLRDTVSSKESHFLSPCPGLKDLSSSPISFAVSEPPCFIAEGPWSKEPDTEAAHI